MVTMKRIAQLAGVSRAAVSAVVNDNYSGSIRVGKKTQEHIKSILLQTNYRPNAIGIALISGKSSLIGLVVENVSSSFIPEFIEAIEDEAEVRHYGIILVSTRGNPGREHDSLEFMLEKQVDGLILTSPNEMVENNIREQLSRRNIPVIHLSYLADNPLEKAGSVVVDPASIGQIGLEHLLDLGHKHIVCAQFTGRLIRSAEEVSGKTDAIVEFWSDNTTISDPMREIFNRWTNTKTQPTAFFINGDQQAIIFMNEAIRAGVRIPQDLSVIGIDDIPEASQAIVPLTTVFQPKYEQGQAAARLLFSMLDGEKPKNVVLQPKLIVRDSTSKIS